MCISSRFGLKGMACALCSAELGNKTVFERNYFFMSVVTYSSRSVTIHREFETFTKYVRKPKQSLGTIRSKTVNKNNQITRPSENKTLPKPPENFSEIQVFPKR